MILLIDIVVLLKLLNNSGENNTFSSSFSFLSKGLLMLPIQPSVITNI